MYHVKIQSQQKNCVSSMFKLFCSTLNLVLLLATILDCFCLLEAFIRYAVWYKFPFFFCLAKLRWFKSFKFLLKTYSVLWMKLFLALCHLAMHIQNLNEILVPFCWIPYSCVDSNNTCMVQKSMLKIRLQHKSPFILL